MKLQHFLARESVRLEKFITEHREFYTYYKSGRMDKDSLYFTRNSIKREADPMLTKYDSLVAMLMALQRYHEYVVREAKLAG